MHVSALQNLVLWTSPRCATSPDLTEEPFPATAIARFGSVAFPADVWKRFHAAAAEVPEPADLLRADGRAVRDAWAAVQSRPAADVELVEWLRVRLLAADSLDTVAAIRWIEHWLRWFGARPTAAVEATVSSPQDIGAKIEKLYFDGPSADDWPALAQYQGTFVPALSPDHIFIPASAWA